MAIPHLGTGISDQLVRVLAADEINLGSGIQGLHSVVMMCQDHGLKSIVQILYLTYPQVNTATKHPMVHSKNVFRGLPLPCFLARQQNELSEISLMAPEREN
jgi:hypothetical protein